MIFQNPIRLILPQKIRIGFYDSSSPAILNPDKTFQTALRITTNKPHISNHLPLRILDFCLLEERGFRKPGELCLGSRFPIDSEHFQAEAQNIENYIILLGVHWKSLPTTWEYARWHRKPGNGYIVRPEIHRWPHLYKILPSN